MLSWYLILVISFGKKIRVCLAKFVLIWVNDFLKIFRRFFYIFSNYFFIIFDFTEICKNLYLIKKYYLSDAHLWCTFLMHIFDAHFWCTFLMHIYISSIYPLYILYISIRYPLDIHRDIHVIHLHCVIVIHVPKKSFEIREKSFILGQNEGKSFKISSLARCVNVIHSWTM